MSKATEQQFAQILVDYRQLISKVCYMYATDSETYNDLYQEVLVNIWQGLVRFRGECRLSTWIYRLAINTCVSFHRSTRRHTVGAVTLDSLGDIGAPEDSRASDLREMYNLISRLNPLEKALIMLWLDEKSYDEIAEISGISKANVASRLHRIKQKLITLSNS